MQERIVSLAFDVVSNILETGPVSSLFERIVNFFVFVA